MKIDLKLTKQEKSIIENLCNICNEYERTNKNIEVLKANINSIKDHLHLQWAIGRDSNSLNKFKNKQIEIGRTILNKINIQNQSDEETNRQNNT